MSYEASVDNKVDIMANTTYDQENEMPTLDYTGFEIGNEDDSVALIIDGNNLYKLQKNLQIHLNYKVLDSILYHHFPNLQKKSYFTTEVISFEKDDLSKERGHSNIRAVLDFLRYHRYTVVAKPIEAFEEQEQDINPNYINMDVEIVTEMFTCAKWAKHIIFVGSNKKFAYPLRHLHEVEGKTITVISTVENRLVADSLRQIDNFVDLNDDFFRTLMKRVTKSSRVPTIGRISAA